MPQPVSLFILGVSLSLRDLDFPYVIFWYLRPKACLSGLLEFVSDDVDYPV